MPFDGRVEFGGWRMEDGRWRIEDGDLFYRFGGEAELRGGACLSRA
jgi:hypothetical protein